MASIVLPDDYPELARSTDFSRASVVLIESGGDIFDVGYELFERVFEPDVLDSKECYLERFDQRERYAESCFPFVMAAIVHLDDKTLLAGIASSDLMALPQPYSTSFLAIGNVATSPACRGKGIGALLYRAAVERANNACVQQHRVLDCVVLESEDRSLEFWRKMGFRWPKDMVYFQPPLEWNRDGSPVHKEVRETFLLAPVDTTAALQFESAKLIGIVNTLYENWSIRDIRGVFDPEAVSNAERYLQSHVTGPVQDSIRAKYVELVDPIQSLRT